MEGILVVGALSIASLYDDMLMAEKGPHQFVTKTLHAVQHVCSKKVSKTADPAWIRSYARET